MKQITLFERKKYEKRKTILKAISFLAIISIFIFLYYQISYLLLLAQVCGFIAIILLNKRLFIKEIGKLEFDDKIISLEINGNQKYKLSNIRKVILNTDEEIFSISNQIIIDVRIIMDANELNLIFYSSNFSQKKIIREFLQMLYSNKISVMEYDKNKARLYLLKQNKYSKDNLQLKKVS